MKSKLRVFKFGGASVHDAEGVRRVGEIVKDNCDTPLVIVVSAMGKMTAALEDVTSSYVTGSDRLQTQFAEVKEFHWKIASDLFEAGHGVFGKINDLFVEIDWVLEEPPEDTFEYLYDQIVSVGELISTHIVSAWLSDIGVSNTWLDVRDVLKTDNAHREARIDWNWTEGLISGRVPPMLRDNHAVVTQGFIGCTSENFTSTLGKEGSDYSAAVFANVLDAAEVVIWKDVEGVFSGDPKMFDHVSKLDRLSYREAIEMTYYGAKVIHPKTIKPLQNKSIPLFVRSFTHLNAQGTWIGTNLDSILPPIIVLAEDQALIHISTKDFSFVGEEHLSKLFGYFATHRIKINLMRNTAISFSVCCRRSDRKIEGLRKDIENDFNVVVDFDLQLLTVRHSNEVTLDQLLKGKTVVFEERFKDTVQCVLKSSPTPTMKN
ncbi:MAG: aspartate kinase [Bacteroidetes bacterium]|nr:MAG: aspartate kinase [Bacteroidota bacterium]